MTEDKQKNDNVEGNSTPKTADTVDTAKTADTAVTKTDDVKETAPANSGSNEKRGHAGGARRDEHRRNPRRPSRRSKRRDERARPEFDQKIVSIRRVTRVMAGGRRFSFSVSMVAGNKKGKVGVGVGKAADTQLAIEKAFRAAKKNMIQVPMNKDNHIPHDVQVKYSSSEVMIMPAPGKGLVAGSSVRTVLELAGVKDVTAKIFSRSKNKLNNARAAIKALSELKT